MITSLEGSGTPVRPAVRRRARTASPCTSRSSVPTGGVPVPRPLSWRGPSAVLPGVPPLDPRYRLPRPVALITPEVFGRRTPICDARSSHAQRSRPPVPGTSRSPRRVRRRRRRQDSLLEGAVPLETPRDMYSSPRPSRSSGGPSWDASQGRPPGSRTEPRRHTPCEGTGGAFLSAFGVPRELPPEYGAGTSPISSPIPRGTVRSPPGTTLQISPMDGSPPP